jgi:hypothetical protein
LAAVALAIVSTKPREHFTRGAGGYFAAMIKRAKTGELHLDRTLWKLRRDRLDRIEGDSVMSPIGGAARHGIDSERFARSPSGAPKGALSCVSLFRTD